MNTYRHIQAFTGIYRHLQTCTVRKNIKKLEKKYIQNIYIYIMARKKIIIVKKTEAGRLEVGSKKKCDVISRLTRII